jgi:hypothetical protein
MTARTPFRWNVAALILAVCSIGVVLLPLVHRSTDASSDSNQPPIIDETSLSLLASEGWNVLIPVTLPVLVTALPVLCRHHRRAQHTRVLAAGMTFAGVTVAMASIGILYLPVLGTLIAAALTGAFLPGSTRSPSTTSA